MEANFRTLFLVLLFSVVVKELNCVSFRTKKMCSRLTLKNGRVRYRPKTFAQFACARGYVLLGDRYSKCTNGVWDNPTPACIKPNCKMPKAPNFGLIYPTYANAFIRFFCNPGYEVSGPTYAYCDGAQWNTHMPSCLPSNVTASVSCNFESPDICGWTHDLNHNFDWERLNFKTPSGHVGTGPKFDHTMGENGAGYYMYIESSTRNYNDMARLISPIYKKQATDTCLEFYYHMYGSGIGELRVYMKKSNESWTLNPEKAIFTMSANQGDEWLKGFVEMGTIDNDFQIIFEGIRGISYVSDIAIDDVRLIEDCTPETTTMTFTTEDYTRTPMIFESCENRCFKPTNLTIIEENAVVCDCDENCDERSSCCPDFASICIIDSTDSTEETTYADTTMAPTIPTTVQTTRTTSPRPTPTPYVQPTLPTIKVTPSTTRATTKITSRPITETTSPRPRTSTITTTPTTRRLPPTPPTPRKTTPTKTTPTKTTAKATRTTTKTITRTTNRSTMSPTSTTTMKQTTKNTLPEATPKRIEYIDDVVPFSATTTDEVFLVEVSSLAPLLSESVTPEKPSNVGTVKVVIGLVVGVILLLGGVFLVKKVNMRRCMRRNMRHNNYDSQSDVRFLTSDEMLDFTVAKPSDY